VNRRGETFEVGTNRKCLKAFSKGRRVREVEKQSKVDDRIVPLTWGLGMETL
jgi:hypothetical protein